MKNAVEKVFAVYRNIVRGIAAAVLLALLIAGIRETGERGGGDLLRKILFYTDPAYTRVEKDPGRTPESESPEFTETPPDMEGELYMLITTGK